MFVTFEGIDGCGKSTQILLLAEYLREQGHKVITIREPGGTPLAESVREILLNGRVELGSRTELMLFEAARSDLVEKIIIPALAKGTIVLCDRFYDSTLAYQGYGRKLPKADVKRCNYLATHGITPNLTFYLEVSYDISLARRSVNITPDRIESENETFFNDVCKGYRRIAEEESDRMIIIDANRDIKIVHQELLEKFSKNFNI